MTAYAELRRHEFAQILDAAGQIESACATFALKMMMVRFIGPLVPNRLAGNLDGL